MTDLPVTAQAAAASTDPRGFDLFRLQIDALWRRLTRWEYWPAWMIYSLLTPHFVRLALRHRSFTVFTAANPGFPLGGMIGESKFDILRSLPSDIIIPTARLETGPTRLADFDALLSFRGWSYPLVLKPDVGERGAAVRLVRNREDAEAYLTTNPVRTLVQPYHPGPFEVGIFYVRNPQEAAGTILSVTVKHQPRVTGDGTTTLRGLILRDARHRVQAATLFEQLGTRAHHVPCAGETVLLAIPANHCRGTLFRDGAHLITPELAAAIDAVARATPGFFFGRFDVRYSDPAEFAQGRGLAVVELNGVLSESTNMYDPRFSLFRGLRILADQWTRACAIGAENIRRGAPPATLSEIRRALRTHRLRGRVPCSAARSSS